MAERETETLRVLVADESRRALEPVGDALRDLGHEVIALEVEPAETARATHEHRPDLAIVALHEDTEHALELIREIVDEATCPVCLLAGDPSREFLSAAARNGVFAHLDSTDATELAGRHRHRGRALPPVPRPARRVRPPRADRARQGPADGAPRPHRGGGVRAHPASGP